MDKCIMQVRPLSQPLQEIAQTELNEVSSQINENLENLRDWLSKQPHLKYNTDDQFLLNFLRGSKFSLERTKKKLDAFYTFRSIAPELSRNLDPLSPDIQTHLKCTAAFPLPTPEKHPAAPRVMLCSYSDYDPDETLFTTMMHGEAIAINVLVNSDDNYVVSGAIIVWDMKKLKFKSALQLTPSLIKKMVYCFENAFPTRMKAVYIINMPPHLEQMMKLLKMLVSKKLAKRFHFYSFNNMEIVFKHIPKSIFPKEYGGDAGSIESLREKWKQKIEEHRNMLLKEDNYYSDESKRIDNYPNFNNCFGLEGSFKNLNID